MYKRGLTTSIFTLPSYMLTAALTFSSTSSLLQNDCRKIHEPRSWGMHFYLIKFEWSLGVHPPGNSSRKLLPMPCHVVRSLRLLVHRSRFVNVLLLVVKIITMTVIYWNEKAEFLWEFSFILFWFIYNEYFS